MIDQLSAILYPAVLFTLKASILVLFPGILAAMAIHTLNSKTNQLGHLLFKRAYGWIVVSPSVMFHELSHAIICLLFGHKIEKIGFFESPEEPGYILHTYSRLNPIHRLGNLFIGISPLIVGTITIFFISNLVLPEGFKLLLKREIVPVDVFTITGIKTIIGQVSTVTTTFYLSIYKKGILNWMPLFFIYSIFVISSAMRISKKDALSSLDGMKVFVAVFFISGMVMQTLTHFGHPISISIFHRLIGIYLIFYPVILFGIVANLCLFGALMLTARVFRVR